VIYVVNTTALIVSDLEREADRAVKYLADATGGSTLYANLDRDVAKSFQKIQQELRSQYAVGYRPRNLISGLLFRTIRILGPKGIRIRYRAGYFVR